MTGRGHAGDFSPTLSAEKKMFVLFNAICIDNKKEEVKRSIIYFD